MSKDVQECSAAGDAFAKSMLQCNSFSADIQFCLFCPLPPSLVLTRTLQLT